MNAQEAGRLINIAQYGDYSAALPLLGILFFMPWYLVKLRWPHSKWLLYTRIWAFVGIAFFVWVIITTLL